MSGDPGFVHVHEPGSGNRTLLLLHGTGGSEHDLLALGRQLAPDANLLSPRGQVDENGMARFFQRLEPGVLDVEDLKSRTGDLAGFLTAAGQGYGFDPARVIALGFSNGANIAASLLLLHPGLLAGACLLRPMFPFPPEPGLDLSGTRVLIAAGARDPMVPSGDADRLARALREAGAEVDLHLDPDAGHGLSPDDIEAAKAWFRSKL